MASISEYADLIFKQWKAELKEKDRSRKHVSSNFDELFENLQIHGILFDEAYMILDKAIVVHYPKPDVARSVFKHLKQHMSKTEKEFLDDWKESIADAGRASFHNFFPLEEKIGEGKAVSKSQPKNYGPMSADEYKKQRRYADSHPTINTDFIEELKPVELEDDICQQIAESVDNSDINLEDL